jgi:hypothetical protein
VLTNKYRKEDKKRRERKEKKEYYRYFTVFTYYKELFYQTFQQNRFISVTGAACRFKVKKLFYW